MAKSLAKPPEPLNLEDRTWRGDNWKQFKRDWSYYETAAKIDKEDSPVRVAHLLNVIGKDGQDMLDTFSLTETDQKDIAKVLQEFETRCTSVTNVIYKRYVFNKRVNAVRSPASQPALVTCTVNDRHKVIFEIDMGGLL